MRKLTATIASFVLAGSLAIPAPATAETNDVARALAGIAAIAIIAKAIDNRRDRERSSTYNTGDFGSFEQYNGRQTIRRHDDRRYDDYSYDSNRYNNHRHNRRGPKALRGYKKHPLPQACLQVVETSRRDRLVYGARCVNRNFKFASKLPEKCETRIRTRRGSRLVYSAQCLRRDGWRVARR